MGQALLCCRKRFKWKGKQQEPGQRQRRLTSVLYLKFSNKISSEEKQRNIRNKRKARKAVWVFSVSCDTIASPEESVNGTAMARKTTEKNGKSSLFPFFFRRFPATGGIDSRLPHPSIARELSLSVQIPFRAFREFPSVPLFLFSWICLLELQRKHTLA